MSQSRQQRRLAKRRESTYAPRWRREQENKVVEVIDAYAKVARPIMLGRWKRSSCIAATRVTIDVLGAYGIPARPLGVSTALHSAAWVALRDRLGRTPSVDEQLAGGAYSVGLGFPHEPDDPRVTQGDGDGGYDGHLVALAVGRGAVLIDASIDQATRPEHGLVVDDEVLIAGTTPGFLAGEEALYGRNGHGVVISYRLRADPPPWDGAPSWRVDAHGLVEVAIIKAMIAAGVAP